MSGTGRPGDAVPEGTAGDPTPEPAGARAPQEAPEPESPAAPADAATDSRRR